MSSSLTHSSGFNETASAIIAKADQQYSQNKMFDNYEYMLQYKDLTESGVLWRLARIAFEIGKYHTPDKTKARQIADEGFEYAKLSIELDNSSSEAHLVCLYKKLNAHIYMYIYIYI